MIIKNYSDKINNQWQEVESSKYSKSYCTVHLLHSESLTGLYVVQVTKKANSVYTGI